MQEYEGELWDGKDFNGESISSLPVALPPGTGMVQTRTPYITAMQVQQPRNMTEVERKILKAATLLGDEAVYGWGAGKGRVEGASIDLAMAMIQSYGNAVIIAEPVQETAESFIFTHTFIDLESGVSMPRQFREGKRSVVEGKMDEERKNTVRFGRGQSKNIRNTILHAMPKWLVNKAIEEAKRGGRDKMDRFIKEKGLSVAQEYTVSQLKRLGVTEEAILAKVGKAEIKGLDIDDLVKLSSDFKAIDSGNETSAALFDIAKPVAKLDLKDKLKAKVEPQSAKGKDREAEALKMLEVSLGDQPFTFLVDDGLMHHVVSVRDDEHRCDCTKPPSTSCIHVMAVTKFSAGV